MTNKLWITIALALCLEVSFTPYARADHARDACAALVNARSALVLMMDAKGQSAQDALKAKIQAASIKLDSVLGSMTGAEAKAAADFKAVWDQFKATREGEIIPAIYAGRASEAKKITAGVQADRLSKMWGIMSCKVK
jgi:hypothetical protein